ncbi:MAG TPA: family 10 glycosylhydrolase [Terracidiphilus sp.]|nr:family 10 glycosylhydrolase [Terracidiphilus sp.]
MAELRGPANPGSTTTRRDFVKAATIASAIAGLGLPAVAAPPSAVEGRGLWFHPEAMFDANPAKGKAQVQATVQQWARAGFNFILPWTTSGFLYGVENQRYRNEHPTTSWDILGFITETAHSYGLQTHLWYSYVGYRTPGSPDFNPSVGGNPAWAAKSIWEVQPNLAAAYPKADPKLDACPQHPDFRSWQNLLIGRTLKRYPLITGIHVEENGYDYRGYCCCDLCLQLYQQLYGAPLPGQLDTRVAEDFRTLGTSAVMAEVVTTAENASPKLMVSTDGGHDWQMDRQIGRTWLHHAKAGMLDFYSPEIYTTNTTQFQTRLTKTIKDLSPDCPVFAGVGFRWDGKMQNTVPVTMDQINVARELGAKGVILFYGDLFTPDLLSALASGPFHSPAKMPSAKPV